MIYDLVPDTDLILKEKTVKFDFEKDNAKELAENLAETMIKNKGVGLAAPQVGINKSVFVVGDPTNRDSIMAFFNPILVDLFGEVVYYEEGCLSYPGLYVKVKRPQQVRMRFTDMNGETATNKYTGFTARVIQHEFDHLMGITFHKRANPIHLISARGKQQKILKKQRRLIINK